MHKPESVRENETQKILSVSKDLVRRLEGLNIGGLAKTIQTKIGQNTEKSPGDLRRLAVAQTPVRDHLLTLV